MLTKLQNLKKEIMAKEHEDDKSKLILYAIDCAIDEENRTNAIVQEYQERFMWV